MMDHVIKGLLLNLAMNKRCLSAIISTWLNAFLICRMVIPLFLRENMNGTKKEALYIGPIKIPKDTMRMDFCFITETDMTKKNHMNIRKFSKTAHGIITLIFAAVTPLYAQQNTSVPGENLVIENIPALSSNYITDLKSYTEARSASLVAWHPIKKEMLILTRFRNSKQLDYVKHAGGDRKESTFFDEPMGAGDVEPIIGNYSLFTKNNGGNEFGPSFRFDIGAGEITMLTDGKKSQSGGIN